MGPTTTTLPPAPTWDLDSIFPGKSTSPQFAEFRLKVKEDLERLDADNRKLPEQINAATVALWTDFVVRLQSLLERIELVVSFSTACQAADVSDSVADAAHSEGLTYHSRWQKLRADLDSRSLTQSDEQWQLLTSQPELHPVAFYLTELRVNAKAKMPVQLEALALDLSVEGYHAWDQLYNKLAGEARVEFEQDGRTVTMSLGQLSTKMSDTDRSVRARAFAKLSEAWNERAELACIALNSLAGFRLALYRQRRWDAILYEPLRNARMQEATLDAMWRVVERNVPRLQPYIDAKKKLLGIDKFCWYDEFAPVGGSEQLYSFDEAADFVVRNVATFSDDLGRFCRMAVDKRWIEAEDRPGKRGGGFCTGMGPFRQSRIFMTYAGTYENLMTLAHELGHAYHGWVLRERPFFAQQYPMNLAETASTFAEALVTDAALEQAEDDATRLMLLEQKLQGAFTFMCDIHARFLFEKSFYAERAEGFVGRKRLDELMVAAQKRAFGATLDPSGYHPLFWCSKLHFYITDAPFYNFPYTFGFFFSAGVYARARKEGPSFSRAYADLLADTGSMTTEEVARKHLGVDLTTDTFWQEAVDLALADTEPFVALAARQR